MELIIMPRGGGKTTKVVEWLKQSKSHALLVMNERERQRIIKQYRLFDQFGDPDAEAERIITPHTIHDLHGRRNFFMGQGKIAIDELGAVLTAILGMHIGPVTYTGDVNVESVQEAEVPNPGHRDDSTGLSD